MGLSDEELAAEFIHHGALVDANALLKEECGVEYKNPSQVQYYSLFTEHEQAFVRYDLETAWDDSEAFTVEVGVPLDDGSRGYCGLR